VFLVATVRHRTFVANVGVTPALSIVLLAGRPLVALEAARQLVFPGQTRWQLVFPGQTPRQLIPLRQTRRQLIPLGQTRWKAFPLPQGRLIILGFGRKHGVHRSRLSHGGRNSHAPN
jgi:hypothetical protein